MQSSDKPSTGTMDANGRRPWLGASAPESSPAAAAAPPSLRWRGPWRTWLLLSWAICTLASPTFAFVVVLLCIDARSDNPYFWWSLPHRRCRQCRRDPAHPLSSWPPRLCRPRRAGAPTRRHRPGHGRRPVPGGGRRLGLLPELAAMLLGTRDAGPAALGGIALAMGFGVASHVHAGALHAWLAFREPAAAMAAPASRADGGSKPPGNRHLARLERGSTSPSVQHRASAPGAATPAHKRASSLRPRAALSAETRAGRKRRPALRARGRRQRCTALRAEPTARGLRRAASAAGKRGLAGLRIQVRIAVGSVLAVPVAV